MVAPDVARELDARTASELRADLNTAKNSSVVTNKTAKGHALLFLTSR